MNFEKLERWIWPKPGTIVDCAEFFERYLYMSWPRRFFVKFFSRGETPSPAVNLKKRIILEFSLHPRKRPVGCSQREDIFSVWYVTFLGDKGIEKEQIDDNCFDFALIRHPILATIFIVIVTAFVVLPAIAITEIKHAPFREKLRKYFEKRQDV